MAHTVLSVCQVDRAVELTLPSDWPTGGGVGVVAFAAATDLTVGAVVAPDACTAGSTASIAAPNATAEAAPRTLIFIHAPRELVRGSHAGCPGSRLPAPVPP